jgi:hypothetical protein
MEASAERSSGLLSSASGEMMILQRGWRGACTTKMLRSRMAYEVAERGEDAEVL